MVVLSYYASIQIPVQLIAKSFVCNFPHGLKTLHYNTNFHSQTPDQKSYAQAPIVSFTAISVKYVWESLNLHQRFFWCRKAVLESVTWTCLNLPENMLLPYTLKWAPQSLNICFDSKKTVKVDDKNRYKKMMLVKDWPEHTLLKLE